MKTSNVLAATAIILLATVVGCKKYEEGPLVSLRSKKERVANNWRVGQALDNGKDVTENYHQFDYDISKDGKVSLTASYTLLDVDVSYTTTGVWAFLNNNEKISFDIDGNHHNIDYTILKLEEKEMWLTEDDGTLEMHFIPR